MTPRAAAVVAVGLVAGAYALSRAADRAALAGLDPDAPAEAPDVPADAGSTVLDWINPWGAVGRHIESYRTEQAMHDENLRAFLTMIATAEGTERAPDPYRVCYGYAHTIADLSDHPAVTGEWRGERLPDAMCRGAGLSPGCVSTAAGRYQLIRPTWLDCKRALGLPDFTPASQDAAAVYLIRKRGALPLIEQGRIADAIAAVRREWASLPGAGYGQPERRIAALLDAYTAAGGALA